MLIGRRVILEDISPNNIEKMREWRNDPELRKFFREYKDISCDSQNKWYNERGSNKNSKDIYFQIIDARNKKNKLIGCCGLLNIRWEILRDAEFSIFLSQQFSGEGMGKEALLMMCEYGFKALNLNKIWAEVYGFNEAISIYKNIGFVTEAVLRDSCFYDGNYCRSYIISMLSEEWKNKYKNYSFSTECA